MLSTRAQYGLETSNTQCISAQVIFLHREARAKIQE